MTSARQFSDRAFGTLGRWLSAYQAQAQLRRVDVCGRGCRLGRDVELISPECLELGDGVAIGHRSRIQAVTIYHRATFRPRIVIGTGTTLENDCHVSAVASVAIGRDVLIASGVFISDHLHDHRDVTRPVREQPLRVGAVEIGDGSHIGEHAAIFGSVVIGRNSVVGANAVVTGNVEPFTVVVGVPARPISRYDERSGGWRRVD
jgi:acetyltransferase-like isoleucine patch superfamily enzyme